MRRSKSIDMLRALAIIMVLGRHAPSNPPGTYPFLNDILAVWYRVGWIGVDIFFVLSGFLVSGLLFREYAKTGTISGTNFLIRRGFRIYPPYWVFLFGTMAFEAVRGHYPPLGPALAECFFLQDYLPSLWGHTWSLAVEEQFYLLLILLFLFLVKWKKGAHPLDAIPWIFLALLLLCLGLRLLTSYLEPFSFDANSKPAHLRMDSLFCGVFLAYLDYRFPAKFRSWAMRWRGVLLALGVLFLLPGFLLPLESPFIYTFGFTLFLTAAGLLLTGMLTVTPPDWKFTNLLASIGANSYSIYLYHMVLSGLCITLIKQNTFAHAHFWLVCSAYFFGAIIIGITMARVVEIPMLRVRDRLFPSETRPMRVPQNILDRQLET